MEPAEVVELEGSRVACSVPPGLSHAIGEALCIALPLMPSVRMVNRGLGITAKTTDAELDEIEAFFQDAGVEYQLSPAEPGLEARLEDRGLVPGYPWMKFVRGVEPLSAATDLRVERIGRERAGDFARVVRETWDIPAELDPWLRSIVDHPGYSCYVTYDGDTAAGAGTLFLHEGAAWLGWGSTLTAFRGRGSQSALFAARIAEAKARGATLVVTETGVPREDGPGSSYRNILRAGFREAYVRPNYIRS